MTQLSTAKILLAYKVCEVCHYGQYYGGRPYFLHPIEVASELAELGYGTDSYEFVAALLHDTVEDSDMTVDTLSTTFGGEVAEMVGLLTKREDLSYRENIERIIDSGNLGAMKVKLADNRVNLRNSPKESLIGRYEMSISMLEDALNKSKDGVS